MTLTTVVRKVFRLKQKLVHLSSSTLFIDILATALSGTNKMMLRKSLVVSICTLYALYVSSANASLILGQAPGNDATSVNTVVGLTGDDAFEQDLHTTSIDGDHVDEFGPKLGFYTVHDADPNDPDGDGTAYDSDDHIVQWWLEGVPVGQALVEPFYIVIKVGGQDNFVFQWDTSAGDTLENPGTGGAGFVDYHSMVYDLNTNPLNGSSLQQGISHVSIVARMVVPEPSTLVMGLLFGALGLYNRYRA